MKKKPSSNTIQEALDASPNWAKEVTFIISDPATAPVEPIQFIIDGMAARGLITIMAGPAGSGKSYLMQYLLQSRTRDILPVHPGVAVYLTGADASESETRNRARKLIHYGHGGLLTAQLENPDVLGLIHDNVFRLALTQQLLELKADAVVFDTLRDYYDGDSKEAQIANKTMVAFRKLAEQARVAVIIITHTRKNITDRNDPKVEDVADSRIYTSKADFVFGLQHEYLTNGRGTLVQINNLKSRSSQPIPRIRYLVTELDGHVHIHPSDDAFENERKVKQQLEKALELDRKIMELAAAGLTQGEIAKLIGKSRKTVNEHLKGRTKQV